MKILFISNGIYEYDGRLRELIRIAKIMGNTQYITRVAELKSKNEENHITIIGDGFMNYICFIVKCVLLSLHIRNIDILFIDNRKAVIPGIIIRLIKRPRLIVQDVRELYLFNEVKHISGKIGCIIEQYFMRRADIVICANQYRADIMKDYFGLVNKPLIYENIRSLEYTGRVSQEELDIKYSHYFQHNTIKLISTSGCDICRTNDRLVLTMEKLKTEYELFLVGGGTESDMLIIKDIIKDHGLYNVHILGKLNMDELKYFVQRCDIGIVNYSQEDTNNKYCASGKIYEFLFEGLPIITTENKPLVDICNEMGVGIADDCYVDAIIEVAKKFNYYSENVKKYVKKLNVEKSNLELVQDIMNIMKKNN